MRGLSTFRNKKVVIVAGWLLCLLLLIVELLPNAYGFELPAEQLQRSFMRAGYCAGSRIVTIDGSERMDYDCDFKASMCRN